MRYSIYFLLFFFLIALSLFAASVREPKASEYISFQGMPLEVKSDIAALCWAMRVSIFSVLPT